MLPDATDRDAADRVLTVRRPADGSVLGQVPVRTASEVDAAVQRARTAQRAWCTLPLADRIRRLSALGPILADRVDEIVGTIQDETGKPEVEALAEVVVVIDLLRFYARTAPRMLRPRRVGTGWLRGKTAWVRREPYGVVGAISPWNYPFVLVMDPVVTGVFAGNAVVVKPSEFTPFTALLAPRFFEDARLPEHLVQVVTGDGATGSALVCGGVDKVAFTGSPETGRKILAGAADRLTPVQLELGGKDPAIVLEDADLDRAADGIAFGAFFNAGQTCISVERVYAVDPICDAFTSRLAGAVSRLRAGTGPGVDIGPMTTPGQLSVVEAQLRDAHEGGARALTGGERTDPASNVMLPTVLVDVHPRMAVVRDESFGPLVTVMRVRDEEEAISRANDDAPALFASLWTGDVEHGQRLALRLRAGGVSVNDVLTHYAVPGLPMGGVGPSGFGRARGLEGLLEMSRTRSVLVRRRGLSREPYWFPYREGTAELLRGIVQWRGGRGVRRLLRSLLRRRW